jgi:hypothetical protein
MNATKISKRRNIVTFPTVDENVIKDILKVFSKDFKKKK